MPKGDDKTEQPTARRLREARREGQLPQSTEVPQALTLIVAVLVLPGLMRQLYGTLSEGWRQAATSVGVQDPGPAVLQLFTLLREAMLALVPLVVLTSIAAVGSRALLGGLHLNLYHLKPKWKQLNFFKGLKNLFSLQQLSQLGRLFLKIGALAIVTLILWKRLVASVFTGPADVQDMLHSLRNGLSALLVAVLVISVVAGAADGIISVRRHRTQLRMTKQEVREDSKQSESNPLIKSEIRARQRRMSRMRMMAEVGRADVVLTNPTHLAVALRYEDDDLAPRVVAKGAGHIAARIRELAAENGVPVRENKPLARALFHGVEIGDLIPVELYQAVAEVLAVVYQAGRRVGAA